MTSFNSERRFYKFLNQESHVTSSRTHGIDDFPAKVMEIGFTGFYLRVVREGVVTPDDYMTLIEPHGDGVTVDEVNQVRYHDRNIRKRIQKVTDLEPLAEGLKQSLLNRMEI